MKSALNMIENELEAIRQAGTWREERIITTPQRSRIDTTAQTVWSICAPTTIWACPTVRS